MYAGTRRPLAHPNERVTALTLDVTSAVQIQAALERVESLDLLINNAGVAIYDDLTDPAALQEHLAVNLFGPLGISQAFLPQLAESRGMIVNVVSDAAIAAVPIVPAYPVSKAAALSISQSFASTVGEPGVNVHAVLAGPIDTDMSRGVDMPKASPDSVARAAIAAALIAVEPVP